MTPTLPSSNTNLISTVVSKLRSLSQFNMQSSWYVSYQDIDLAEVINSDFPNDSSKWEAAKLNHKEHIAWERGKKTLWLVQRIKVPHDLNGYPISGLSLRLGVVWWAESGEVYVDGKLIAQGDLFDFAPRVLLKKEVTPKLEFTIALRLVSPGHDDGALVRSLLFYESDYGSDDCEDNFPEPNFIADELAVVNCFLKSYSQESSGKDKLESLKDLVEKFAPELNGEAVNITRKEWEEKLGKLRKNLKTLLPDLKEKMYLLGHAHLDLAWLWRVEDTWKAAQNTFESVLSLQEDFPELIFTHSSPALYAWIEENRPDLFTKIQNAIANGSWEVAAGMWVEPELNLISGESIVRQLFYGQRYVLEKFGKVSEVVWLPDSFGFCGSLPQFLVEAGVKYFVTQKLRWNDSTKFEHGAFWWRSPDGSQIFSYMSPLIGESIDPVKMVEYSCEWREQTGIKDALWLPGVGDHGGGPTRDMLEVARRWQNSDLFPDLEFKNSEEYIQSIQDKTSNFPVWNDELYLEFHRGCYTTHGDQKRLNRKCENLLYEAELFASLATITTGVAYPQKEIESSWKKLLFNQFHDILPGSAIPEVYEDAAQEWVAIETTGSQILQQSLEILAQQIHLPSPPVADSFPVIVFNSLNWIRESVVISIDVSQLEESPTYQVYDADGNTLNSQLGADSQLLFLADEIPSVGYRVFWLVCGVDSDVSSDVSSDINLEKTKELDFTLENNLLRVRVDEETGDLTSIFDKVNHKEILCAPGNQLQAFADRGQYWDAWNIDPNYAEHQLPPAKLKSIEWIEIGEIQNRLRVVRVIGSSEFQQDYILQANSAILKINTLVDWKERQVMVKTAFPVTWESPYTTYETPCATITRPNLPQTPAEEAKWEVPALRWADLSDNQNPQQQYGISLLNDCKYGYDSKPNQLRLTLLRSPNWPNPEADKGIHHFSYAIYPHTGNWEDAETVKRAYEFNHPLHVLVPSLGLSNGSINGFNTTSDINSLTKNSLTKNSSIDTNKPIPNQVSEKAYNLKNSNRKDRKSFINLGAENLILMALKQAEDHARQWIIRCYESQGKTASLELHNDMGLKIITPVDLLEHPLIATEPLSEQQNYTIAPRKIFSILIGE
ncbi:MAG: alpha-mannosidase [Mastigocoleus sp.]